jgi:hypothetical protein
MPILPQPAGSRPADGGRIVDDGESWREFDEVSSILWVAR